jgi:hypothetical protein
VKYKTVQDLVDKSEYSLSVPAHIPVTVLVVQVVSFCIHPLTVPQLAVVQSVVKYFQLCPV